VKVEQKVMAENTAHEAVWTLIKSFQETNQAITESFVASQERTRRLAERFFTDGMEVLKTNQAAAENLLATQESSRMLAERFFKDGLEILKTNQAAAENLVAAQEGNVKYAQRFFKDGVEILERQAESMRTLMQVLEQQARKQQEALQTLAHESVESYAEFLRTPLSYYQQLLAAAETLTRQGLENFQKATQQAQSAVQRTDEQQSS